MPSPNEVPLVNNWYPYTYHFCILACTCCYLSIKEISANIQVYRLVFILYITQEPSYQRQERQCCLELVLAATTSHHRATLSLPKSTQLLTLNFNRYANFPCLLCRRPGVVLWQFLKLRFAGIGLCLVNLNTQHQRALHIFFLFGYTYQSLGFRH